MPRFALPALTVLALLAAAAARPALAQIQFPMNPRSTFLFTNQDAPAPPLIVDLAAANIAAGDWLEIGTTGAYSISYGFPDNHRTLIGLFSSDTTIHAWMLNRVPGAIAAGPSYASAATWFATMATDIPEDFFCSRVLWDDRITVQVPAGALFLMLGTHDSLYGDNSDPNSDFTAVITPIAAPTLPGTGEHIELSSGVGGAPTLAPDIKPALPGQTVTFELRHPLGFIDGSLYLIALDVVPTSQAPAQQLPRLWLGGGAVIVQLGTIPTIQPSWTATQTFTVPPGFPGLSLRAQAGALSPLARNGLFMTTNAHRIDLQ